MAADGTEVVLLSQLKTLADGIATDIDAKLDAPASEGTAGQYLQTNGSGTYTWATVGAGTEYTGTDPVVVSGNNISVSQATETSYGTVKFASDTDFNDYLGI